MDDLKIELITIFDAVSHERKQRILDYAKSLKDGPRGNMAPCCNNPLAVCKCEGRE